ncbi:TPA: hypothetical protein PNT39_004554 [Salmonella enterica]|nr:hypothetical protein [Salmonella enterica]HCH9607970.1 hypothetical protein [Salmonella enterica]HDI5000264.1 hypothetical protein [Salmonella enterica]HDI5005085.1 hypothetical protein [Salmonella enterica]HDI5674136.1 hypothetical protein [Salmonella enterica]
MVREVTAEELLAQGFIKVGSKSYCEYWKKGDEVISINTRKGINIEEYNSGYEDALRAIKINLEHFKKDVYSIEMIYEGCDIDRYEGESACEKLLFSEILGVYK